VLLFFASITPAGADQITIPVSVSTSGFFSCVIVAPCTAAGNVVTIPSGAGSATVTFTGVNETFDLTNTTSTVTIGRFDVVAPPGYTWPVASINPVLSIFRFTLEAENPLNSGDPARLFWEFGPGGGVALTQRGPWNFGLPPDVPSPWPAANFMTNAPILVVNQSADITAQAGLVPEPATMLMVGSGLAGLLARCRRRRGTTTG
jgi:hypothetical protein